MEDREGGIIFTVLFGDTNVIEITLFHASPSAEHHVGIQRGALRDH